MLVIMLAMIVIFDLSLGLGRIQGGGVQGSKDPPLVPREGVLDPSSKMKKTAFIIFSFIYLQIDLGEKQKHIYLLCELHKITSRKYEGMFLLEKKWNNSVKMFYLLSCYNASEQLSGHQISKFSWGAYKPQTPSCIWLASLAVASGNFPVN